MVVETCSLRTQAQGMSATTLLPRAWVQPVVENLGVKKQQGSQQYLALPEPTVDTTRTTAC